MFLSSDLSYGSADICILDSSSITLLRNHSTKCFFPVLQKTTYYLSHYFQLVLHIFTSSNLNCAGRFQFYSTFNTLSIEKHRKEMFLYVENAEVEKTSDLAEQHFSIQSWLLKHGFKTKEGLLRTFHWYHRYLSTRS